jgi:hypothetical protein
MSRASSAAVKPEDVFGSVREVIRHAPDPTVVGDDATAVAVDETGDELFRGVVDQRLLPRLQRDASCVLLAGAVLGYEAGPVFEYSGTSTHLLARCNTAARSPGISTSIAPRQRSMIAGYFFVENDSKTPHSAVPCDAAVAEMETQQIAVRRLREGREVMVDIAC